MDFSISSRTRSLAFYETLLQTLPTRTVSDRTVARDRSLVRRATRHEFVALPVRGGGVTLVDPDIAEKLAGRRLYPDRDVSNETPALPLAGLAQGRQRVPEALAFFGQTPRSFRRTRQHGLKSILRLRLVVRMARGVYPEEKSYHYAGKYLASYLPELDVFNCKLSAIREDTPWPPSSSRQSAVGTYGEFYRSGRYTPHRTVLADVPHRPDALLIGPPASLSEPC